MELLIDVEPQTDLTKLALEDGIVTVYEYQAWMLGYMSGSLTAPEKAIKLIKENT